MKFPVLSDALRAERLRPPSGKVRMVLDTDTFNEVDDQFAVAYALRSTERLDVEALYAAPFFNSRSSGPEDGMEKSYEEIGRLLERLEMPAEGRVLRGSTAYLTGRAAPEASPATQDLVERGMEASAGSPLYVVAIGAITNVASALLLEPRLVRRIVVVWLGGQPQHWPDTREFNLIQDPAASRLIFDCGVPVVQVPCFGAASHLLTTLAELERHIGDCGEIGAFLVERVRAYHDDHFAWAKEIWDLAPVAYLVNPDWVPTHCVPSPVLTSQMTWSVDPRRHWIRVAQYVHRNPIFADLFGKLAAYRMR